MNHYLIARLKIDKPIGLFHSDIYNYYCFTITADEALVYELKGMCTYASKTHLLDDGMSIAKRKARLALREHHDVRYTEHVPYTDVADIVHIA